MWRRWYLVVLSGLVAPGCESVSDEICARACACGTCGFVDGQGFRGFESAEACRNQIEDEVQIVDEAQCDADLDTAGCSTTPIPVKDALILPDSCGEGDWSDE